MAESPIIIQMNIARYQELLGQTLDSEKRSTVERLLEGAKQALALAKV